MLKLRRKHTYRGHASSLNLRQKCEDAPRWENPVTGASPMCAVARELRLFQS
jgi:hypothetical protein